MHRTSDFDYPLPPDRIAQEPLPDRAASRLLVLERATGVIRHRVFRDVGDLLAAGDVLVLNTSRVIPARLHGKRETGTVAELLLVRELPDRTWLAMGHPGGKLKPGRTVRFGSDSVVEIMEMLGGGLRRVKFHGPLDARATLEKYGEGPPPPYLPGGAGGPRALPNGLCRARRQRRGPHRRVALHAGAAGRAPRQGHRRGGARPAHRPRHVQAGGGG